MSSCQLSSTHSIANLFSLSVSHRLCATDITMKMLAPVITTRRLTTTLPVLRKKLPSVLESSCFNDQDLPFFIEVRNTEIGHLFEHILLEYLCQLKFSYCDDNHVEFSGRTSWNWVKEPQGIFHITIDITMNDHALFQPALIKTIDLVATILHAPAKSKPELPTVSSPPYLSQLYVN